MIDLYNGDCLEVMDKLIEQGVKVDAIITDPPYGLKGEEPIELTLSALSKCKILSNKFLVIMDWRNNWQIDSLFKDRKIGEIIWEYGWVSGGRCKAKSGFFPTHNSIGLYGNKQEFKFIEGSIFKRDKGLSSPRQCSYAKKTGHPYEKPVKLIEKLLINSTKEGDLILDPFMGSGTTGVACKKLNRNFIGIELDKNYFDIAENRIKGEK